GAGKGLPSLLRYASSNQTIASCRGVTNSRSNTTPPSTAALQRAPKLAPASSSSSSRSSFRASRHQASTVAASISAKSKAECTGCENDCLFTSTANIATSDITRPTSRSTRLAGELRFIGNLQASPLRLEMTSELGKVKSKLCNSPAERRFLGRQPDRAFRPIAALSVLAVADVLLLLDQLRRLRGLGVEDHREGDADRKDDARSAAFARGGLGPTDHSRQQ